MEFTFPCSESLTFEDEEVHEVSKKFQFILCIQGQAEHPHHYQQLKSSHKDPDKRHKLKQFTHLECEFKILYLMIVSPGGPELGRQNRHDIATWEVANNLNVRNVRESIYNAIHHGDRRSRLSEFLLWVPTIAEQYGPDLGLLSRRPQVQTGMPAFELEEWPAETDHLKRVQAIARAVRLNLHPDQKWYEQFKKDMKLHDHSWTWHEGYGCRRRHRMMRVGVVTPQTGRERLDSAMSAWLRICFAAPCQNVFSEEFQRSRQRKDWSDARHDWIDRCETTEQTPPHAHIEEMQENSQWETNAP